MAKRTPSDVRSKMKAVYCSLLPIVLCCFVRPEKERETEKKTERESENERETERERVEGKLYCVWCPGEPSRAFIFHGEEEEKGRFSTGRLLEDMLCSGTTKIPRRWKVTARQSERRRRRRRKTEKRKKKKLSAHNVDSLS